MTVNVKALIQGLGQSYEVLFEAGLIPYKTKPKGDSGSPRIGLDMSKEGVYISFDRESRKLIEVDIDLIRSGDSKYVFPNELPHPLWDVMYRPSVREKFGTPTNYHPPFEILGRRYGGVDHYIMQLSGKRISMLLHYNLAQTVVSVSFEPTENIEWKDLDPSLLLK
jgi:hypothetical protein